MARKSASGCANTAETARACQSRKAVVHAARGWAALSRANGCSANSGLVGARWRIVSDRADDIVFGRAVHCSDLLERCKSVCAGPHVFAHTAQCESDQRTA